MKSLLKKDYFVAVLGGKTSEAIQMLKAVIEYFTTVNQIKIFRGILNLIQRRSSEQRISS